ncbi:2OG-Fe(II) oxygenase [Phenylobacterium sp. J367]|uniref:2OG-Fe(II) oxygenase n=1 Tax=Phenylobacterium sp. J367 TaxID=2898435 RepID=UPI002150DB90|nr:2OG-Fe(II) oxygenase [Phenylobacterium sp. J367]MCR5880037.1 2OG-Fe(II) oxygenase [Phenylobacterium sp. J367]
MVHGPHPSNPEFVFDTAAGRYVLLVFLPLDEDARRPVLMELAARQRLFDGRHAAAFAVARDPQTIASAKDMLGLRWFLDADGAISRRYEVAGPADGDRPVALLLDPSLRILAVEPAARLSVVLDRLEQSPPPGEHAGVPLHAPVLICPRIFEPELCRDLIAQHEAGGGQFTGVMRDKGGRTVMVMDDLKKRRDVLIENPDLKAAIRERLEQRVFPLIERAMVARMTRIERYLVSCYDAADEAVFHAHRDNTTLGTAHRAFACSINLNDDFEGGDLRFTEFGPATYRPPVGGGIAFSCSLMHEATRVTRGRRYAFLPFFYDEAGAAVRAAYEAGLAED